MSEGPAQECADDDLESEKGTEIPLPDEVVSIIIGHVISDPSVFEEPSSALGRLESVNRVWRGAALRMYRMLCRRRRKIRYPQLEPVFTWHNFDTDVYPGLTKGTIFLGADFLLDGLSSRDLLKAIKASHISLIQFFYH